MADLWYYLSCVSLPIAGLRILDREVGDLLFSRANTSALVGATAMVERDAPRALLPDKIWRFVWQEPSPLEARFVHGLLQNRSTRVAISSMATGTGGSMKNISQSKLRTLPFIVPPIERQERYAGLVSNTRWLSDRLHDAQTEVATLSASLSAGLLAGMPELSAPRASPVAGRLEKALHGPQSRDSYE